MDENKIIIAVCGDSFCAGSDMDLKFVGRRAHFSQILQDQYGYKVLPFGHGAFGNTAIFFQIQEAIKQGAHVVVYNQTWHHRIAIRLHEPNNSHFQPERGLKNFVYWDQQPSSDQPWAGNLDSPILNRVHDGIETFPGITPAKVLAIKQYLTEIFDYDLQKTLDGWLFDYWQHRMKQAGILPLYFNDGVGKVAYEFSGNNRDYDTPFHTDLATQQTVAANIHTEVQKWAQSSKK